MLITSSFPCFSGFGPLCYKRHTGVPREFLKHSIPDYLIKGTDLFTFRMSNLKNDNSQYNNNCLAWINQNHTYFLSDQQKPHFVVCHRILVVSLCVPWDKKGCKSLSQPYMLGTSIIDDTSFFLMVQIHSVPKSGKFYLLYSYCLYCNSDLYHFLHRLLQRPP